MTTGTIQPSQHAAARLAGALYLVTMATAVFAQIGVRDRILVRGDAVQSALNIVSHERLFRIGVLADLLTIAGVIVLLWALQVALEPAGRNLARLATYFRLAENCVAAATLVGAFVTLRVLRSTRELSSFDPDQAYTLARVFLTGQGLGLAVAFVFLGLGSTLFSVLWLRSGYIPRAIALWGIFASLVLAIVGLALMLLPELSGIGLTYMMPMFVYEVGLGSWLLVKGLREPGRTAPDLP